MVFGLSLSSSSFASDSEKDRLRDRVNKERSYNGCPKLKENKALNDAAQAQAEAMPEKKYFGHVGPDGETPDNRARSRGYAYRKLGENVAAGQDNADHVVNGWMNSKAHRQAMLDCDYTEVGSGHAYMKDDTPFKDSKAAYFDYWAQVYAKPENDDRNRGDTTQNAQVSTPKSRRSGR
jgi:uncharacterized protein YkwD